MENVDFLKIPGLINPSISPYRFSQQTSASPGSEGLEVAMAVRNGNCQCSDPVLGPLYCLSFNKRRRMFKASPHIQTPRNVTMTITKKHVTMSPHVQGHFRNGAVFETGLESGILQNSYFEAPGAREISSSTQSSAVRIPPSSTQLCSK